MQKRKTKKTGLDKEKGLAELNEAADVLKEFVLEHIVHLTNELYVVEEYEDLIRITNLMKDNLTTMETLDLIIKTSKKR